MENWRLLHVEGLLEHGFEKRGDHVEVKNAEAEATSEDQDERSMDCHPIYPPMRDDL